MKRKRGYKGAVSRSVYLTPAHDEAARTLAERNGLDMNKALRVLIQRGLDAPEIPEFMQPRLEAQAAARKVTIRNYLTEIIVRALLERSESTK